MPLWFIVILLMFFHITKAQFSSFLQFKGNIACVSNKLECRHSVPFSYVEIPSQANQNSGDRHFYLFLALKRVGIFRFNLKNSSDIKNFSSKIPNIDQNQEPMSQRCILCTFNCFIREIWQLVWESGRLGLYMGDSRIIRVSWHRCRHFIVFFRLNKISDDC